MIKTPFNHLTSALTTCPRKPLPPASARQDQAGPPPPCLEKVIARHAGLTGHACRHQDQVASGEAPEARPAVRSPTVGGPHKVL